MGDLGMRQGRTEAERDGSQENKHFVKRAQLAGKRERERERERERRETHFIYVKRHPCCRGIILLGRITVTICCCCYQCSKRQVKGSTLLMFQKSAYIFCKEIPGHIMKVRQQRGG